MDDEHVYPRDASWYRRPNVTSPKVAHWAQEKDGEPTGWSACGRVVICNDMPIKASRISEPGRCRGPGCRQRWAAWVERQAA